MIATTVFDETIAVRLQLRQVLLQFERSDLLAVFLPFLTLVAQEVFEGMLAEHSGHEVGLLLSLIHI